MQERRDFGTRACNKNSAEKGEKEKKKKEKPGRADYFSHRRRGPYPSPCPPANLDWIFQGDESLGGSSRGSFIFSLFSLSRAQGNSSLTAGCATRGCSIDRLFLFLFFFYLFLLSGAGDGPFCARELTFSIKGSSAGRCKVQIPLWYSRYSESWTRCYMLVMENNRSALWVT